MKEKGFTLVEMIIVIFVLSIIVLIVIAAINPIEQVKKMEDSANEANARELLSAINRFQALNEGKNPVIQNSANSYVCSDIVAAGPIFDTTPIANEISDWFIKHILKEGSELYAGFVSGGAKLCYRVNSVKNIANSLENGCTDGYIHYLCLPH